MSHERDYSNPAETASNKRISQTDICSEEQNAPGTCDKVWHKTDTSGSQSVLDAPEALRHAIKDYERNAPKQTTKGITLQELNELQHRQKECERQEKLERIYDDAVHLHGLLKATQHVDGTTFFAGKDSHYKILALDALMQISDELCTRITASLDEVMQ